MGASNAEHGKGLLFAPDTVIEDKELTEDAWEPAEVLLDDHTRRRVQQAQQNDPWARKTHTSRCVFFFFETANASQQVFESSHGHHYMCKEVITVITLSVSAGFSVLQWSVFNLMMTTVVQRYMTNIFRT